MHPLTMQRKISPLSDLLSLFRLCRLLLRIRPALVHTHTPKAGLLGMIAGRLAGVPVRIYTINGLVWATHTGWSRRLLSATERLSCRLATDVLTVSESLRRTVIEQGICPETKVRVLGWGGSHGVDLCRFDPAANVARGEDVRKRLGIPADAIVLIFIGRFVREKGIEELAHAWRGLRDEFPHARLLLCGWAEERDPVRAGVMAGLRECPRVVFSRGSPVEMPALYAAGYVCVLPSWREGLPNVALESAAMKLPIVATRISGCVDAIHDGVTGLLVEPRDAESLASGLRTVLKDAVMRRQMGENARRFVSERFSEESVSGRLATEYRTLLGLAMPDTRTVPAKS